MRTGFDGLTGVVAARVTVALIATANPYWRQPVHANCLTAI